MLGSSLASYDSWILSNGTRWCVCLEKKELYFTCSPRTLWPVIIDAPSLAPTRPAFA